MDIGISTVAWFGSAGRLARRMEERGFASVLFTDSQNLCPDVWCQLVLAAKETDRIRLGPGVTNPVTRDPAVTACAAITLQVESAGRALVCVGRGDSAVQRLGLRAQRLSDFEDYLESLQHYLQGDAVDRNGFASRLEFLPLLGDLPKVPIEVMASGPRVIELASRVADRVCLAVGADPEFLAARLERGRRAAKDAGRADGDVSFGAIVNCVAHEDMVAARDAVRGGATTFARFSAMPGSDVTKLPEPLAQAVRWIRENYDMKDHTRTNVAHTKGIPDAFVDWFSAVGGASEVSRRLQALADLGLDFVHLVPGSTDADRAVVSSSLQLIADEVLPGFAAPTTP